MKLHIKYMVSRRCKIMVQAELDKLGVHYGAVDLGEVDMKETITAEQRDSLKMALLKVGLQLMEDKKAVQIEKIKIAVIEMVHYSDELPVTKYSNYISEKLKYDYTYLANLFFGSNRHYH